MVCLGNICRSPLAQGILESKLLSKDYFIDSAGTSAHHQGELPDSRSIAIAENHGLDITQQRSRKFKKSDFDKFDVIYVMDESNFSNVMSLAKNEEEELKVRLILTELESSSIINVPDPYYGGENGFKNVYAMLDEVCDVIVSKLL